MDMAVTHIPRQTNGVVTFFAWTLVFIITAIFLAVLAVVYVTFLPFILLYHLVKFLLHGAD